MRACPGSRGRQQHRIRRRASGLHAVSNTVSLSCEVRQVLTDEDVGDRALTSLLVKVVLDLVTLIHVIEPEGTNLA